MIGKRWRDLPNILVINLIFSRLVDRFSADRRYVDFDRRGEGILVFYKTLDLDETFRYLADYPLRVVGRQW